MKMNFLSSLILTLLLIHFLAPGALSQKKEAQTQTFRHSGIDTSLLNGLQYRLLGPWRGGRSAAVTGVPGKEKLYYFGATGGGVWKTEDAGLSWENISDGYFGGSIGAVEVAPSDNNVIYVGGGEKTVRGNVSYGYGIWKSVDAGDTWVQSGLEQSRHIPRICVHPDNSDIVFAAVLGDLFKDTEERGVYKSTDGGKNWRQVLFANSRSGAVDLIMDPNNPRILYASTWRVHRNPYELSSGGEGSALWKSTDSGETWENISERKGLPSGIWGIAGVAVSPVNSKRVWAIIENEKGGVFRSDDGGLTWQLLNDDRSLRQRAWYYTRIYADPDDKDLVYVLNVSYHKSIDGGKTFSSHTAPHGDHHDLWIAPENPKRMIIGDDGGAQVSHDGGETWTTYHNQPTAQFYRVTTDNHFPFRIYAAQQDNSTIRINHRSSGSSITEDDWEESAGCECGYLAPDPDDPDIVFGGCYDGFIERKDHRTGYSQMVHVWPENPMGHGAEALKYRFQWNFPIFFSPHDGDMLYTASNHLHRSLDGGQSWEVISPDLTRNDSSKLGPSGGPITKDNTSVEYYCTIFAAAESPAKEGLLWVGSDDGLVHISTDGGINWSNVTPSGIPEWIQINSLEPSPHDEAVCYVAATMYKSGDYKPYIYKTSDFGKTWEKIVNGIGEDHFTRVIRADPLRKGMLYAGTESGVYVSTNDGRHWQPFQLNLPVVPITDLAIRDDKLIIATQGRSLWIFDELDIVHQMLVAGTPEGNLLFIPAPTYRISGRQARNPLQAGTNHPSGVVCRFFLPGYDEKDTVALTFLQDEIDTIAHYFNTTEEELNKLNPAKGLNIFEWNMRYPPAERFEGMILWWSSLNGPQVPPGSYTVTLSVNGQKSSQKFEILQDPRSEMSGEEYRELFSFEKSVWQKLDQAHKAIKEIRDIRSQLDHFTSRLESQEELLEQAGRIDSVLTLVEEALYQTQNKSRQDPLNFPIRLTNKLGHLNSLYSGREYPPPQQAYAVRDMLIGKIDAELNRLTDLKESEIPAFNRLMKERSIDAVILKR